MNRIAIAIFLLLVATHVDTANAQPLGTFRWQLHPYCNVLVLAVTQVDGVYRMEGIDNQCGSTIVAPAIGLATVNPAGTIGVGLNLVTAPGGAPIHIEAALNLTTLRGPWHDSSGNSGTLLLNPGTVTGTPRPLPAMQIPTGFVTSAMIAPGAVDSLRVLDGSLGAADIDDAQIQRRVAGACVVDNFMYGIYEDGKVACAPLSLAAAGSNNTKGGTSALKNLTTGNDNTGIGASALSALTVGDENTAVGSGAMASAKSPMQSVAIGFGALRSVVDFGWFNTAVGAWALQKSIGGWNTAIGKGALGGATTGFYNVALGVNAGARVTTGSDNIHIAHEGGASDTGVIHIGTNGKQAATFIAGIRGVTTGQADAVPVMIDSSGQLGTVSSSQRVKQDIVGLASFTSRLQQLRPVQFRYRAPFADGSQPVQYGLIAEEVASVMPELVARSADGEIETVKYHLLPTLLLAELQRLEQERAEQARAIAELQQLVATLLARQ